MYMLTKRKPLSLPEMQLWLSLQPSQYADSSEILSRLSMHDILISCLCTPTCAVYGVGMDSPGVGCGRGQNMEIGSKYKCLWHEADL
jgi:hypothetical protein